MHYRISILAILSLILVACSLNVEGEYNEPIQPEPRPITPIPSLESYENEMPPESEEPVVHGTFSLAHELVKPEPIAEEPVEVVEEKCRSYEEYAVNAWRDVGSVVEGDETYNVTVELEDEDKAWSQYIYTSATSYARMAQIFAHLARDVGYENYEAYQKRLSTDVHIAITTSIDQFAMLHERDLYFEDPEAAIKEVENVAGFTFPGGAPCWEHSENPDALSIVVRLEYARQIRTIMHEYAHIMLQHSVGDPDGEHLNEDVWYFLSSEEGTLVHEAMFLWEEYNKTL